MLLEKMLKKIVTRLDFFFYFHTERFCATEFKT